MVFKRTFITVLRNSLFAFASGCFITLAFVLYALSDLNNNFDHQQITKLQDGTKHQPKLRNDFFELYKKNTQISSSAYFFLSRLFGSTAYNCPCYDLAERSHQLYKNKTVFTGNAYLLAWRLERQLSQLECLNSLVLQWDFANNSIGVHNAAINYFNSTFEQLNQKQLATLIIMLENPLLYNPKRNTDHLKRKLNAFQWVD